ncbi:MAG: hypothetical protein J5663_08230 [Bacteroidaceae bacterium]|nr:hypothetical protein [Bacteroidaceae bacterium]
MKKYLFPVVALVAAMASCTSDVEEAPAIDNSTEKQTYIIGSKPFEFVEDLTRTTFTLEEKGLLFSWSFDEVFGVFPINPVNNQAMWALQNGGSIYDSQSHLRDHYAQFNGQGWGLEFGTKYAAYQPYNGEIPSNTVHTAVPVTMPTTQGGTLTYIGKNVDFMCDTSTYVGPASRDYHNEPWEGPYDSESNCEIGDVSNPGHQPSSGVTFDFDHSIAIIQIKVPESNNGITVTAQSGNPFITAGTWNLETGVVTGTDFTNTITLTSPENVENGVATFYLAAFPTTTGACIITVDGNTYQVASKTLVAGKAYRWNVQ